MKRRPKGPEASAWRKKKYDALRKYSIPENILPGSLSKSTVRCGKPTCHCATGEGHPNWTLSFTVDGLRRVEHVPAMLVEQVQRHVDAGREFREAITDVMNANAELLFLERKQRREEQQHKKRRPTE